MTEQRDFVFNFTFYPLSFAKIYDFKMHSHIKLRKLSLKILSSRCCALTGFASLPFFFKMNILHRRSEKHRTASYLDWSSAIIAGSRCFTRWHEAKKNWDISELSGKRRAVDSVCGKVAEILALETWEAFAVQTADECCRSNLCKMIIEVCMDFFRSNNISVPWIYFEIGSFAGLRVPIWSRSVVTLI